MMMNTPRYLITAPFVNVKREPDEMSETVTQFLYGEVVTLQSKEKGFLKILSVYDHYEGWIRENSAKERPKSYEPDYMIGDPGSFVFPEPNMKTPPLRRLPFGSRILSDGFTEDQKFLKLKWGGFVPSQFVRPIHEAAVADPVFFAKKLLNTPYLWGGRTFDGLDCSALVQLAYMSAGIAVPRDAYQQEAFFDHNVTDSVFRKSGDIVFWKGHVGMMYNAIDIIHANAFYMRVTQEPLENVIARAETPITAVKRYSL